MGKLQKHRSKVTKALKMAGLYDPSLTIQIDALASAMLTLEIATNEIEGLDSVILERSTTQGVTVQQHPCFKVQKDAQAEIRFCMKQLGLITENVVGKPEQPDNVDSMLEDLTNE